MVHEDPCAKLIIPHVPAIFYTSIRHLCYCLLVEHRAYCVKLACAMRTKGRLYRVLQSEARASDKKLLGTKGIATESKDATRGSWGLDIYPTLSNPPTFFFNANLFFHPARRFFNPDLEKCDPY